MKGISAVVLTHNSESLIGDCLDSLKGVGEIVIVDSESIDHTLSIAKKYTDVVTSISKGSFSDKRNLGAKKASGEWLLYIDDDERLTPLLKKEIERVTLDDNGVSAYAVPRRNFLLGKELKYGGWKPDYQLRLIKKEDLEGWHGELHETPKVSGRIEKLVEPMIHISHRDIASMMDKTNEWSEIEAKLLFDSKHPPMNIFRFASAGLREFWYRGIKKLGFLDGSVGTIEVFYQTYSKLVTYAKLWELQLKAVKSKNK